MLLDGACEEIYSQIKGEMKKDFKIMEDLFKARMYEINWNSPNIFDSALRLREFEDGRFKNSLITDILDDPEIIAIFKKLQIAVLSGRMTGL